MAPVMDTQLRSFIPKPLIRPCHRTDRQGQDQFPQRSASWLLRVPTSAVNPVGMGHAVSTRVPLPLDPDRKRTPTSMATQLFPVISPLPSPVDLLPLDDAPPHVRKSMERLRRARTFADGDGLLLDGS